MSASAIHPYVNKTGRQAFRFTDARARPNCFMTTLSRS